VQNILKEKKDKDRLSLLTEASSDALYDWDIKNNRLWLSESYSSLFGKIVKGDNVRGWWSQRVHPEDLPRILSDLADSLNVLKKGLWSGEYRYRTLKGEYLYVKDRSVIVRDNNGEVTRIAGALTDITEQKLAEENLKNQLNVWLAFIQLIRLFWACNPPVKLRKPPFSIFMNLCLIIRP